MLSFQSLYTNYTDHTGDSSSGNTTIGKARINDTHKELLALHNWYFSEASDGFTPTASTQSYRLPFDYGRMKAVTIRNGNDLYNLTEVPSMESWQRLNVNRHYHTSDIPTHYFVTGDTCEIYPIPTTTLTTDYGTFYYIKRVVDMTADDYTTGTVSITNGTKAVTGSSTTFTSAMAGRYIKFTTDARWYEVASYTSATAITLRKNYEGLTISGGAYTIGEMPLIPEDYHSLLWYQPVAIYWMLKKEREMAAYYQALYDKGRKDFLNAYGSRTTGQIMRPAGPSRLPIPDAIGGINWAHEGTTWDDASVFWSE